MKNIEIVHGDLLDQPVDAIVNAWNRNIIPWWLLLPQGVSRAIKKRGGYRPFLQLGMMGSIPLGGAVVTSAGKLPFKAIVHVAGINVWWRASPHSIQASVQSALEMAEARGYRSLAFPTIGAGTGGMREDEAIGYMLQALHRLTSRVAVRIVQYAP